MGHRGEVIQLTADFGIKETTFAGRAARMVGAGDLVQSADGYRLSDRFGPASADKMRPCAHGPALGAREHWHMLIVTSIGTVSYPSRTANLHAPQAFR